MFRPGLRLFAHSAPPLRRVVAAAAPARARLAPLTARRTLLEGWGVPQPPGNIVGGVNDAVPVPAPEAVHGSYHWDFERLVAIAIVPLAVWPVVTGHLAPVADALFGGLLVVHTHIGFGAAVTDYIPKRKFPRGFYVFMGLLYAGSAGALFGVYKLATEDEGIVGSIRKIWTA